MALRIPSRSGLAHLRGHKKHLTVDQFLDSAPGVFLVGSGVSGFKAPVFFLGSGAYSDNHPASAMFQKRKPGDETGLLKDDPLYCGAARAPSYLGIVSRGAVSLLVAPSPCALPLTPVPPWSSEFGLGS
jgi:hypothetical protein